MIHFTGIRCHIPDHDCEDNKALRIIPEDKNSYWFCKICFKELKK